MTIIAVGLSHQTTPIELREKLYISPKKIDRVLNRLKEMPGIDEVVLLSTCNRTEIYAVCDDEKDVIDCLRHLTDADLPDLRPFCYIKYGKDAAGHLFRVTAGLDSLAIGEDQIQGQVADALKFAQTNCAIGKHLNRLFQTALSVGKLIRTETSVSNGEMALSRIAFDLVAEKFPDNPALSVLLIGAGEIAEATAKELSERHAHIVFVANRTRARAVELAAQFGGEAVNFHDIDNLLAKCDVVISSTAAPHTVITAASVTHAMQLRENKPLHLIDLALPRDIEQQACDIAGVYLYNLDNLQDTAQKYRRRQQQEIQRSEEMITVEIEKWCVNQSNAEMARVISALHNHCENIRVQEINAARKQMESFTPGQHEIVESITRSIIKKLLHSPTVKCKERHACGGDEIAAELLCELFGLPDISEDEKECGM